MTRNQRTAHARTFAILTPLFVLLIGLALVRANRTSERLRAQAAATTTTRSVP